MADDGPGALELMDRATAGIRESESFTRWVRNSAVGTIVLSATYAVSEAILAVGSTLLAPFRAISGGLADAISGTFGAGVDVVAAGGEAAETSFLEGAAAYLGPAAFPVAVASIVAAIYVLQVGYQQFSPLDWISGLWSDDS